MSLKAIKEALDYLENNPTADEAQAVRRRARVEIAALEKAARVVSACGIRPPVSTDGVTWEEWSAATKLFRAIMEEQK